MGFDVQRIEQACRPLVGVPLFASHRAGMQSFQFGTPKMAYSILPGRPASVVGDYALHVQCAWCLFDDRGKVVASDKEHESIKQWLDVAERSVVSVHVGANAALMITLNTGALHIVPDGQPSEQWRLFRPGHNEAHFVVGGAGIEEE
jgi:hypothetical protein